MASEKILGVYRGRQVAEMFQKVELLLSKGKKEVAQKLLEKAKNAYKRLSPIERAYCDSLVEKQKGLV